MKLTNIQIKTMFQILKLEKLCQLDISKNEPRNSQQIRIGMNGGEKILYCNKCPLYENKCIICPDIDPMWTRDMELYIKDCIRGMIYNETK